VLLAGGLVGGVLGNARYTTLEDDRPLCGSCHHGVADLSALESTPPHSTDFDAGCHGCHVLPARQYLEHALGVVGVAAPDWVHDVENPVLGGQTCLECHLARGRGVVACEQCHAEGTLEVRFEERCEACHADRLPAGAHAGPACRDCHVEVYLDREGRVEHLMRQKLGGDHAAH
jgi:hypothetical protein